MNKELKKIIADYFDADTLLEILGVSVEDLVDILEEEIKDNLDEILEEVGYEEE